MATREEMIAFLNKNTQSEVTPTQKVPSREEMISFLSGKQNENAILNKNSTSKSESLLRGATQGATLGFADEMSGVAESLWEKAKGNPTEFGKLYEQHRNESRENFKKAQESNPATYGAGEIGAGVATAFVPGLNLAKGASLAKVAAMSGLTSAAAGAGFSESDSALGVAGDAALGGVIGTVAPIAISKGLNSAQRAIGRGAKSLTEVIEPPRLKLNKDEIITAADKLGIKVTPGMLDDTGFVERLESTLASSPGFLGRSVARNRDQVTKKLSEASTELTKDATNLSPYQLGEQFKSGVTAKIGERLDPISTVFNEVAESTKAIGIGDKSKESIIRNIQNMDTYKLTGGAGKPSQYVDMIGRLENADQVKTLMTLLNQDIKATQGAERHVLIGIKDKMQKLENNSIMRAAIKTAKEGGMRESTGKQIGKEIVSDLKDARAAYRNLSEDLQGVAETARIKTNKGPSSFLDSIESIPSERIQDKFFNVENNRQLIALKDKFPEQFDLLRQGKLKEIADASTDRTLNGRGDVSSARFLKEVNKLNPEAKQMLFGDALSTINDIQTIQNTIPRNFNPSGTASSLSWSDALYSNAKEIPTYLMYRGASSNMGRKVGEKIANIPKLPEISGAYKKSSSLVNRPAIIGSQSRQITAPQLMSKSADEKPTKGPEKWANDGIEMILQADQAGIDRATLEKLKTTQKGKELLFEASTAKNKKAMENVIRKIRTATNGVE